MRMKLAYFQWKNTTYLMFENLKSWLYCWEAHRFPASRRVLSMVSTHGKGVSRKFAMGKSADIVVRGLPRQLGDQGSPVCVKRGTCLLYVAVGVFSTPAWSRVKELWCQFLAKCVDLKKKMKSLLIRYLSKNVRWWRQNWQAQKSLY